MTNGDVLRVLVAGLREDGYNVSHNRANNEVNVYPTDNPERYNTAVLLYTVQDNIIRIRRGDGGYAIAKDPWELDADLAEPDALDKVTACIDQILSGKFSQPSRINYENWAIRSKPSTTSVISNPGQS